ncbi:hypothetical protein BEQ56_06135 [Anaerolineaceae bacterium oral taxon 439]|nr:hypothetical protein BEQ56_06135 [Anaerolineaceae bacterium oral taxon 439]
MGNREDPRLIARVARLYYEKKIRQSEIAEQLGLSQAAVSRLLSLGEKEGIIKVVVQIPRGVYTDMEEHLAAKYHLKDVVIADCSVDRESPAMIREIGTCAASYVENILRPNDVIGLSSWSTALLAMVDAMAPVHRKPGIQVVQILGGLGTASAQNQSTYLANRLSNLVNGPAYFLPLPAVVLSREAYQALITDKSVCNVLDKFSSVNTALVGIGDMNPSSLLSASGNVLSEKDLKLLSRNGAVGDILLRFFDRYGTELDENLLTNHVISMSLSQLRNVERAIGIAGGLRKFEAIRGALRGRLINILVTDQFTAERLLND